MTDVFSEPDALFDRIVQTVDAWCDRLVGLSHSLHAEPEPPMQEYRSADKIVALVEDAGFAVNRGSGGLPTAFTATSGTGPMVLAVCAEYDALPGLGHACGHNVHGAAAVGAAIALAAVADDVDVSVRLVGTPAEESVGGKVVLLDAGVFDGVAAAVMAHSAGEDTVNGTSLAMCCWRVVFRGRPAHAANAPWQGVNALDASTLAYTAIGLLRQQLPPSSVVSYAVVDSSSSVNVIPDLVEALVEVRAPTVEQLRVVQERVRACLQAGALASGVRIDVTPEGNEFAELRQDDVLTDSYVDALRRLGRPYADVSGTALASTDMGNVSHVVPAIHPTIGYDVGGAAHHSKEFADHGTSESADQAVVDGAVALAWSLARTALDRDGRRYLSPPARALTSGQSETILQP